MIKAIKKLADITPIIIKMVFQVPEASICPVCLEKLIHSLGGSIRELQINSKTYGALNNP
jgi:hypothetical protein